MSYVLLPGRSWQDKVSDMRTAMGDEDVDMLVVTGLDETACKFIESMMGLGPGQGKLKLFLFLHYLVSCETC